MAYRVFTLHTDGRVTFEDSAKAPDLAAMQKIVGGYIEPLGYFAKLTHDGRTYTRGRAYANEDGLSLRLASNPNASAAWRSAYPQAPGDLVGDVLFYAKVKE